MGILKKQKKSDDTLCYCKNCEYIRFCSSWGEYKCIKLSRRIIHPEHTTCVQFKKAKTDTFNKKCQCRVCSERTQDEQ